MGSDDLILFLAIILIVILLLGCSSGNAPITAPEDMQTVCLDGVTYYQTSEVFMNVGYGYMAPKFDVNSKVVLCAH